MFTHLCKSSHWCSKDQRKLEGELGNEKTWILQQNDLNQDLNYLVVQRIIIMERPRDQVLSRTDPRPRKHDDQEKPLCQSMIVHK